MAQPAHAMRTQIKTAPLSPPIASAIREVEDFVLARRGKQGAVSDLLEFEKALHAKLMGLEREIVKEELEQADIDVPAISIEGTVYRRVLRAEENYQTAAGEIRVMRTLYKDRTDEPARASEPELAAARHPHAVEGGGVGRVHLEHGLVGVGGASRGAGRRWRRKRPSGWWRI